jgi:hypothetical protein
MHAIWAFRCAASAVGTGARWELFRCDLPERFSASNTLKFVAVTKP